jgi:DNA-binding PucR family transcriptional regulator
MASRVAAPPVHAIAERLDAGKEDLARRMVARYAEDIVDYRLADEDFMQREVYAVSLENLEVLVAILLHGEPPSEAWLEKTRRGAARRLHEGISLESFLHATRLWGQLTWEHVLECAHTDEPAEREAALEIAGEVFRHLDTMSATWASAYLAEAEGVSSDRAVLRRDLLDALIAGKGEDERIRRLARSLGLSLGTSYVVIVLHGEDTDGAFRTLTEAAREHLRPAEASLLVGLRQGEVVALYPAREPAAMDTVRLECTALAGALADAGVSIGLGARHDGMAQIAVGYAEAKDAADIAVGTGLRGRPVAFDEVLIDHMVRSSPHGDRILDGTLRPLLDYDAERQSELVPTLRAYVDSGFNLTKSAELLSVHPNTVVYRLKRIKELSGRDPHDPDDLLLLFLGLKLTELTS